MYTTTLAMAKRCTKITSSITITIVTYNLLNLNISNLSLILAGQ